jgi:hypothetical protein
MKVLADDKRDGIVAFVGTKTRFNILLNAGAITVPPVEYLTIQRPDGLQQPVRLNVGTQAGELVAFQQRKDVGEWVELHQCAVSHSHDPLL